MVSIELVGRIAIELRCGNVYSIRNNCRTLLACKVFTKEEEEVIYKEIMSKPSGAFETPWFKFEWKDGKYKISIDGKSYVMDWADIGEYSDDEVIDYNI